MRRSIVILFLLGLVTGCDETRVFEKNVDFENRVWMMGHKPEFEFGIQDTTTQYNIYCSVRNSLSYPYSRLFLTWYLQDSIGKVEQQKLVSKLIFDPKTGKPEGTSGLGDIYDHRFLLIQSHRFRYSGIHKLKLEQFMRKDTLEGVLAVGVRIEKATGPN